MSFRQEEEARRRAEAEERQELLPTLRETTKEKEEYPKIVLELAQKGTEDVDTFEEYRMCEAYDKEGKVKQDRCFALAMEHYKDVDGETEKMNPFAEQEAWEEHQIGKAQLKFGAVNKKKKDDYDYVFEDNIEFIKANLLDGHMHEDMEMEQQNSAAKSALMQLHEERKLLPIYHYGDELLQAINDHQVLVIVGETGSGKTTQIPQYLHEADTLKKQGLAPEADFLEAAVVTVLQIHVTQPARDVLVFFTGQKEIEAAEEKIQRNPEADFLEAAVRDSPSKRKKGNLDASGDEVLSDVVDGGSLDPAQRDSPLKCKKGNPNASADEVPSDVGRGSSSDVGDGGSLDPAQRNSQMENVSKAELELVDSEDKHTCKDLGRGFDTMFRQSEQAEVC
ncbi:hypothetical protein L7F22_034878 [Adiantum nelumboides]|nr:hypothetical protein [Adiantum nelumboides]